MQIAFAFDEAPVVEETAQELPEIDETPAVAVNVGVRVKAFNEVLPTAPVLVEEPVLIEEPVEVDEPVTVRSTPVFVRTKSTRGRKPLKSIELEAERVNIPEDAVLFQKQYYAIGEVAGMFGVNTSLIRFWANEFDMVQPRKNRKGDRHFRPVDIKNLLLIHELLRRRKLTIEGAKDFLKKNKRAQERHEMIESLRKIKGFLLEVKTHL